MSVDEQTRLDSLDYQKRVVRDIRLTHCRECTEEYRYSAETCQANCRQAKLMARAWLEIERLSRDV